TLWVSKLIINRVVQVIRHETIDQTLFWELVALDILLAVAADVLSRLTTLVDSLLGDRFSNSIDLKLMKHAVSLDLTSFEDPAFYDKMERARRQGAIRMGLLASLAGMAKQLLTLLTLMSAVILFSPWLLLLLAAATLPVFLGETQFALLNYSILYQQTPARRELDYLRYIGASNHSAKEVKIFGLGDYLMDRLRGLFGRFYHENKGLAVKRAVRGSLLNLISTAAYYTAYILILIRALAGLLSVGDLTLLAGAFSRARDIMENLVQQLVEVSEQALYVKDLFDYFDTKPLITSKPDALPVPRPLKTGFEFQDVHFRYPGAADEVFKGVSFKLKPGERIALVGENGAGKTTLVKLLARLYDPTEGRILLDGVDLRDYRAEDLRREIGVLFQDYVRYDMTVGENIGFGRVEEMGNQPKVEQAAVKSLAAPVIAKLKDGYRQMLGWRFDGGAELSTGQWQKIALGRAYMRDAQILILDEPTASLDARAEFEVYQRFLDLTGGKTAVLISHRFSTVRMADRILFLEHGKLVEEGTHQELVALKGKYAELFELQAKGYR
ncbi:MAG TPA: ABC transporter ATP-binding protein, partial [bacterium]|nr:ABC transporter ATP-binding protein [bacterium]